MVLRDDKNVWKCTLLSKVECSARKYHYPSLLWCDQVFDQLVDIVNSTPKLRVRNAVEPRGKDYMMPFYKKEKKDV